jgi:L-seryl-tRNA(Ser) seleniumtransferase
MDTRIQETLRRLPGVDHILALTADRDVFSGVPRSVLLRSIRKVLDRLRRTVLDDIGTVDDGQLTDAAILTGVKDAVLREMAFNLQRVVNATGIVVHTNLGRSPLAATAIDNVALIAGRYSNLEFDLERGKRGSRYSNIESILCEISGAEAALVVNNNAGAVLLALETVARGKKVIVSRGELVEIGGSFRIPDVMAKSGGILCEVGATNRTHLRDYQNAIDGDTALLLKVHKSNYSLMGFTAEVSLKELVELGKNHDIPVMEDLGSGTFIDFSRYGMVKEPTVQESVAAGADIVTFSGDKLLGGPQGGVIVGRKAIIDRIKKNPLNRALRIDKMTLAALESTLRLYREETAAVAAIPTLRMILEPIENLEKRAHRLKAQLEALQPSRIQIECLELPSRPGGGSLPQLELPSRCLGVTVTGFSANAVERHLRGYCPPIIGRIERDTFIMDCRTLLEDDLPVIAEAFSNLLNKA